MIFSKESKLIILRTLIVSAILLFGINLVNLFSLEGVAHNNDWIPFFGSYIGSILSGLIAGLLTFEGVKATIHHTNETRKDDFRKSIMPFMSLEFLGSGGSKEKIHNILTNSGEETSSTKSHLIKMKFKNIGMKPAINLRFNSSLISNSVEVEKETKAISFTINPNISGASSNSFSISIDFLDLSGNLYVQKYELNFEGDLDVSNISISNNMPQMTQ